MGYTSEILDVTYQPEDRTCIMKLKDALPAKLDDETVVFNRTFHTDYYIIRNCRFTNNRARGALLQGSHGLVENNLFRALPFKSKPAAKAAGAKARALPTCSSAIM